MFAIALCLAIAACAGTSPQRAQADVLLLGEVHDNPQGHAARLALLQTRIDAGWRPAIAMEQFDTADQARLDAALQGCADADCVIAQAAPAKAGWDWPLYRPVIALALRHRLPLLAANLSRAEAGKVVKDGFAAALAPELIARYRLDALPGDLLAGQVDAVRSGHCDRLPKALLEPMARAQIARDVMMAEVLRRHAWREVVLLAGNGHVRNDIGVPHWLRLQGLGGRSIGFVESPAPHYDRTVEIPPHPRADPCRGV